MPADEAGGHLSKLRHRPYRSGRGSDWLKVKCHQQDGFVIGGFTISTAVPKGFGALVVGSRDEQGRLVFAGKVGTGFTQRMLVELRERLEVIRQPQCPFVRRPSAREVGRHVHWVRPHLVAVVRFTERTSDGILRHPSFQRLVGEQQIPIPSLSALAGDLRTPTAPTLRARTLWTLRGGGSRSTKQDMGVSKDTTSRQWRMTKFECLKEFPNDEGTRTNDPYQPTIEPVLNGALSAISR